MNSIEVQELTKQYGQTVAVNHVSFTVEEGSLFGFLGVNGAGKSTVINMLSTLLTPTSGSASVCGYALGKQNHEIRNKIGIVYQQNCLDNLLTVEENLLNRGILHGLSKTQAKQQMQKVLQQIHLQDIAKKRYKVLSGGQKRKCEIAAVLLHSPSVLFLDEPTTGLDPATRKDVWALVEDLRNKQNMTVFLTTHYMEEAAKADKIVVIDQGNVLTSGTPHFLRETYAKDKLKLYYKPECKQELLQFLAQQQMQALQQGEVIELVVNSTLESMPLLQQLAPKILGFEVIQGTMDDVFLQVVGKQLGEENEK